jgi:hypothetical protein
MIKSGVGGWPFNCAELSSANSAPVYPGRTRRKIMKTILRRWIIWSVLALAPVFAETASAERVVGKIDFMRVFASETVGDVPMARFEIRVVGTCDDMPTPEGGMYIRVRSGRLDGVFAEINGISFKNAYTTALAAFLASNTIQVDNVPNCTDDVQTINSPAGVGIF